VPEVQTVALLGTGMMGAAMGRRLLGAGFGVRAWNRTRARAEPLAEAGATLADSPADAARGAGILLTSLADGEAVAAAVEGPDGGLAGLAPGSLWIQVSTIGVDDTEHLAALAAEHGVTLVDAPVLGTRQPAEEGKLTILASGPDGPGLQARCQPVFDVLASRVIWVGPTGQGTRLKLVVNTWLHALVGAVSEAVSLAEALGVDPRRFLETIDGAPTGAPYANLKGKLMVEGRYPPSFAVELAHKDVRLALEAAGAHAERLTVLRAMLERFGAAIELGHGRDDFAAAYEAVRPTGAGRGPGARSRSQAGD
jgi:3-hydroxyisobutyrate dehydrogenase